MAWKKYPPNETTCELFESLIPGMEEILEMFYKKHPEVKKQTWEYAKTKKWRITCTNKKMEQVIDNVFW